MKPGLAVGMSRTRRIDINEGRTIGFLGEDMRIYGTPYMVLDVEQACRDFLLEYLTDAENSVGARVEIDHLGPTLKNMWVEVTVTVSAIEGRRFSFDAEVRDALDLVGRAKHIRVVVELAKQRERVQAKAAKVAKLNAA